MVMKKITVLLADDHTVVRQGLRALLETEEDIRVVGEAENGRQAVHLAKQLQPNVIILDVAMPLLNGLEANRQISREVPQAKVLMLSSYNEDEYVKQVIEEKEYCCSDKHQQSHLHRRFLVYFRNQISSGNVNCDSSRKRQACSDVMTEDRHGQNSGEGGPAEAAIQDRYAREIGGHVGPVLDRGAADEDDTAEGRGTRPVGRLEGADLWLEAGGIWRGG